MLFNTQRYASQNFKIYRFIVNENVSILTVVISAQNVLFADTLASQYSFEIFNNSIRTVVGALTDYLSL